MKINKILKDILKLHPELKKDKALLKKTVKFLKQVEPKVEIDQKFKSNLGARLATLATIKSSSVEPFIKKSIFIHIFGWLFASLLAFFGLFLVFSDTLFYKSSTPVLPVYEQDIIEWDSVQDAIKQMPSNGGISEPTLEIQEANTEERVIPNTIIINKDGASQIDVSQPQKLQIQKQVTPSPEVDSIDVRLEEQKPKQDTTEPAWRSSEQNVQSERIDVSKDGWDDNNDSILESLNTDKSSNLDLLDTMLWPLSWEESLDEDIPNGDSLNMEESPTAWSMMAPAMISDSDDAVEDTPDTTEEIIEIQEEAHDEVIDAFTLRCDVFGWEVSIENDIRVCNIWDIICSESDFLKWVCELGE